MASNLHGPNDQLDPTLFTSTIDYTRGRATYNSLIQHANDLTPQPELADFLRAQRQCHRVDLQDPRGRHLPRRYTKLTADDVVYTMKRHQGEDSKSVIKSVLASVKEWKKTGPMEVKAILESPNADLPTLLGLFQTKIVTGWFTTGEGIGTGPYVMDSFRARRQVGT